MPSAIPAAADPGKTDKLASSPAKATQRPVIAAKAVPVIVEVASVPAPLPRIKPQALQQQAALIPRALPEQATAKDGHESCFQQLRAMGAEFTIAAPINWKGNVDNP